MKSFTKIFIGFLVFNAIMANLRQEGVISGQITINYPKLIRKVSDNIFIRFVDSEENMYPQNIQVRYVENNFDNLPVYHEQDQVERLEDIFSEYDENNFHIIQNGETLISLSALYGVSWKQIKAMNQIKDVRHIQPGQKIRIPTS